MIITTGPFRHIIESRIDQHLKYKLSNHLWVNLFFNEIEKFDVKNFPYVPDTNSGAILDRVIFEESGMANSFPKVKTNNNNTKYVALIPAKVSFKKEKISNILNILKNESYGTTKKESRAWVRENLAVVIALNRPRSIDNEVNNDFLDQVFLPKKVDGIAYNVFGFFWYFKWKSQIPNALVVKANANYKDLKYRNMYFKEFNTFLYPVKKSYLLLKCLNQNIAMKLRESLEDRDDKLSKELKQIINMQKIRERMLRKGYAQSYIDYFAKLAPRSSKYLCSLDADVISIRCKKDNKGLFEHYDNLIASYYKKRKILPSFLSTGYAASSNENPVLKAAIDIDMNVRSAMTAYFPAYFPEPNFAWLITNKVTISSFSFMGKNRRDRKLESLRLMQNAISKNLADIDSFVFGRCGHVITNTERMRTKTIEGKVEVNFNKKEDFQSLRSNRSQSHSFPRIWAGQIYSFLDLKKVGRMTNVTTPLMKLYSIFHPLSLIEIFTNYTFDTLNKSFKDVMNFYRDYLICLEYVWNKPTKREEPIKNFCDKYENGSKNRRQSLEIFLNHNIDEMFSAKSSLKQIIEKSTENDPKILTKIYKTAKASGNAIFLVLKKYM